MIKINYALTVIFGFLLIATSTLALACSSCGCNLTSDWLSQGLVAQPGTTISLRYDYVPQTQLRTARSVVDRAAITLPPNREIEQSTYNHYVTAALDHAFSPRWAVNVQVPFVWRPHQTIAGDTTDITRSNTHGLGDVRATVRFQGFGGPGITGVQMGIKLPTGGFYQAFTSGPGAGEVVDRGLQPGSGTTDALIGVYHFGKLAGTVDYVIQFQGEVPLNRRDLFRPGVAATASAGIQYTGWRALTPQLQVNFRAAARDSGYNSDAPNSGGEQLYLAPGLAAKLAKRWSVFGIAQLPVHQRVNGYQLAPRVTLSAGVQLHL